MSFYGKTGQFKDAIRNIAHQLRYKGLDENNEVVYSTDPLPIMTFHGTIKLHGTNAGISYDGTSLTCLSKNQEVTSGHFGFPEMVYQERGDILSIIKDILVLSRKGLPLPGKEKITVYGEWAGPGIQAGVGISEIPEKCWFIFAAKLTSEEGRSVWIPLEELRNPENPRIYNINDFKTIDIDIDISNPAKVQNTLIEIVEDIEKECPVAKTFGVSGIGEGMVFEAFVDGNRHIFKVKGEKHSSSKVKKLAGVDEEKLESIEQFVEYAITENRVLQAIFETGATSVADTGKVIKWVANDVIVEEAQALKENKLEYKQVASQAAARVRKIFFSKIDI